VYHNIQHVLSSKADILSITVLKYSLHCLIALRPALLSTPLPGSPERPISRYFLWENTTSIIIVVIVIIVVLVVLLFLIILVILLFLLLIIISYSTSSYDIVAVDVWCDKVLDACEFMKNGTSLSSARCQHNGNCVNGSRSESPGSFNCDCAKGFTGSFCQYSTLITDLIRRFITQLLPTPANTTGVRTSL